VLVTDGHFAGSWHDARLYAALAATAYFVWRRGLLGTIASGMAVLLALRLGLGW
jgi:branched-subunit amino acid transport protein